MAFSVRNDGESYHLIWLSRNGEYSFLSWDTGAAAARFRGFHGRGQAPKVPWLYGAVLYCWAHHSKVRSAAEAYVCI